MAAAGSLVSVIVPNYNYGHVLGLCLRALQEQTYQPVEIVLVDDCSTDDSVEVAESVGVRAIRMPANAGVCAARNVGVEHAAGDVLFFLDSDIAMRPDAIANAVRLLDSDPRIGAVCGTYDAVPLFRGSLVKEYRNLYHHYWWAAHEGRIAGFVIPGMLVVPAAVWKEIGPWRTDLVHSDSTFVSEGLEDLGYDAWLSADVQGRHDDDATLRTVLRKVAVRTYQHMPFFLQRRQVGGVVGSSDFAATVAVALAVAAPAVPLLTGAVWTAVLPLLPLVAAVVIDRRMYRFVVRTRGVAFGAFFVGVHLLVNVAALAGAAVGAAHWLVSRSFRRLHGRTPA